MKKLIALILSCAAFCTSVGFSAYAEVTEDTVSALLLADTYVECRNNQTVNYGDKDRIEVGRAGNNIYGLLKFTLPEIPADKSVKSAVLKLHNRFDPSHNGVEISVSRLSDDSWDEMKIVGNDVYSARTQNGTIKFPADGTEKVKTVYPEGTAKHGAVELDATEIIKGDYKKSNKVTSLAVSIDADQYGGSNIANWTIWSEEGNATYAPKLEITLGEPEYEESENVVLCSDHGFTRAGNYSQQVQSNAQIILTRNQREGYIKFDLPVMPDNMTVIGATLYTVMAAKDDMTDNIISVYGVGNNWQGDAITWDNAPADTGIVCSEHTLTDVNNGKDKAASFDVTDYVQEKLYTDNEEAVSFKFNSSYKTTIEGGNDNIGIYGKTAAETRVPKLILKVTNDPAAKNVIKDKAAISVPETVYNSIVLPVSGANGSVIVWESSDSSVIATDGSVTRADEDKEVVLTATITNDKISYTKVFKVTVPAGIPEGGEVIFFDAATDKEIDKIGEEITVYSKVRYVAPASGTNTIITARYNDSGKGMMSVAFEDITVTAGEEVEYKTSTANASRAGEIVIYVWNSVDDMTPILKKVNSLTRVVEN